MPTPIACGDGERAKAASTLHNAGAGADPYADSRAQLPHHRRRARARRSSSLMCQFITCEQLPGGTVREALCRSTGPVPNTGTLGSRMGSDNCKEIELCNLRFSARPPLTKCLTKCLHFVFEYFFICRTTGYYTCSYRTHSTNCITHCHDQAAGTPPARSLHP